MLKENGGKVYSKMVFILINLVIISLITIGCSKNEEEKAKKEDFLNQYVTYINEQNYDNMYEMLDDESKANISKEEFVERNKNIYEGIEANNIEFIIKKADEDEEDEIDDKLEEFTIEYTMSFDTMAGEVSFDNKATFVKTSEEVEEQEDLFLLKWDHNLIFPNLESTDKVGISRVEAERGNIYDRNDILLAGKGAVSSVGIVPGKFNSDEDIDKVAELLEVSSESIENKINASWVQDDYFVPIKTIEKTNDDEDLVKLKNNLLEISGIMISDDEARIYPLREKASHLTGYVQQVTAEDLEKNEGKGYSANSVIGKSGLEYAFEDTLKGKDGVEIFIRNESGEKKETVISQEKEDGKDVKLTIDAELQIALYDLYKDEKSCSVAMNPKTGEVLALVSTPSFNANDFVIGMSTSKWEAINEDERNPLLNRFSTTWSPGSSIKPIIAAIGVSTDSINPNEDFGSEGLSWQKDSSWGSHYITTLQEYSPVILENALIYSDNIYFAKTALKIGSDKLEDEFEKIGFDESIPFDIYMKPSQYSNSDTIETEAQLADSGYGQAQILMNPLHLASIYTAFDNGGNMISPYIQYKEDNSPEIWKENVFTEESVDIVKDAMIQIVESPSGTANACKIQGVTIAGKTGTAEIKSSKEDEDGTELGTFAAFTVGEDIDNSLLIVSVVEDVKGRGGSGFVVNKNKEIFKSIYAR